MMPAEERAKHPEGKAFDKFWMNLLLPPATKSCFERDVLRELKDQLWEVWKRRAHECDNRIGDYAPLEERLKK